MSEKPDEATVQLDAVYESLAEAIEGWAAGLGIETTYTDPVLEESGTHDWAGALRRECDWAMRTAASLLTARGQFEHAEDLKRRVERLFDAADAYEQRLDAMEDQCRVHIEGIAARYREMFGDVDPDAHRLWSLCRGIDRVWTFAEERSSPETPEQFAEAVDRALFEEHGAKYKARAEVQRLTTELVEHFQVMARSETQRTEKAVAAEEPVKKKRGKRGPARMSLNQAWRYLSTVQEWASIRERNQKLPMRDRFQEVQLAE